MLYVPANLFKLVGSFPPPRADVSTGAPQPVQPRPLPNNRSSADGIITYS